MDNAAPNLKPTPALAPDPNVVPKEPERITDQPFPISFPHREAGPGGMREFIRPTESAPVIPREVSNAGVEASFDEEKPEIPHEVGEILAPSPVNTPLVAAKQEVEYLTNAPFTKEEAMQYEKRENSRSSLRWLATFMLRQLKKMTMLTKKD